jgi:hypothetical protein
VDGEDLVGIGGYRGDDEAALRKQSVRAFSMGGGRFNGSKYNIGAKEFIREVKRLERAMWKGARKIEIGG